MNAKTLTYCLCCDSKNLKLVLDLNEQPLANSFKKNINDYEEKFPLKLNLCTNCTHLQLSHAVNPDLLFKHYLYVSGTSKTLKNYFDWFADFSMTYFIKQPKTALDIACNDGTQLDSFKAKNFDTYGIDPAENLYELSSKNHTIICDYLNRNHIKILQSKIDIINAQNVFAHTSYPLEFLEICRDIMHENSILFIQTSQADMIKHNEFDTIYHEHLSFFNAKSMSFLANRANLYLIDIVKTPIHGNSYIFVFSKQPPKNDNVIKVLNEEKNIGLQNLITYKNYAKKCTQVVAELVEVLKEYRLKNFMLVGYGAAAKGNTLLNFGNINLDFIIDDNPLKQNMYTPGTNILVTSIDELDKIIDNKKIVFIPLAWNFFSEIKAKIKTKRNNSSDIFVKYFPSVSNES